MKKFYAISGMTCDSCKATIYQNLMELHEVESVEIDREKGEAIILMTSKIEISTLQNTLPSKFRISEKAFDNNTFEDDSISESGKNEKSKFQQLKPLLLILTYIFISSILMNYNNWNPNEAMLDFMGLFYIVFGFFKMLDLKGFPESFKMYDPLAKRLPIYGNVYPFIETGLGLMLLMRFEGKIALIITLFVLGVTTVGVTKTLLDRKSIRCACLGTVLNLPMTEATFIENVIMIVMAISMLINNANV